MLSSLRRGRLRPPGARPGLADRGRRGFDRRRFEQPPQRKLDGNVSRIWRSPAWPAANGRRARRSCLDAHPLHAQHLDPDRGDHLLDRRARRDVLVAASKPERSGAGRALRSSLPLAFSGSASTSTNADGTMYSGSFALRNTLSSGRPTGGPLPRHHVGDQPLRPRRVLARDHGVLPDRRVTTEHGLDLAQLDAETRAASPADRPGPGTRCCRRAGSARGRRCGKGGRPACRSTGSGMNFSARELGTSRYPRATPAPPITHSPQTPIGTGFWRSSST